MSVGDPALLIPYFTYQFSYVALTDVQGELVGANPHRVALTISNNTNFYFWLWADPGAPGQSGIYVNTSGQPDASVTLTFHDYGPVIGYSWYYWPQQNSGGQTVAIMETIYTPPD